MKKTKDMSWADLFYSGQFAHVLDMYQEKPSELTPEQVPFVVGALVFLGKSLEAELLAQNESSHLSPVEHAACVFYLVLSHTRKSQYPKAQEQLAVLQELLQKDETAEVQFYHYQAEAFVLYFCGQIEQAKKMATESLRFALKSKKVFFQILAQDLLGHARVKTGEFFTGLQFIREAAKLALKIGNHSWEVAAHSAGVLYEAEYGYRRESILAELNKLKEDRRFQDSYSQITLHLELARQYVLRGQWGLAEEILNQTAPQVFASENRRQEIILNLHWAKLWSYRGQTQLAMQFLRAASFRLNSETDRGFELKILLAEADLMTEPDPQLDRVKQRILELSEDYGETTERNQIQRRGWKIFSSERGEDALHNFMMELQEDEARSFERVRASGYYAFFYKLVRRPPGEALMYVHGHSGEVVCFSSQEITVHKLTKLSLAVLRTLSRKAVSKDELVRAIWGYEYDPLRHDSLIYSAISQLRRQLGEKHSWIVHDETLYSASVPILFDVKKQLKRTASSGAQVLREIQPAHFEVPPDVNARQAQIIEYLIENQYIDTRTVKSFFTMSEITASRDLSDLQKKGYVIRVGHGRATCYTLGKRRT